MQKIRFAFFFAAALLFVTTYTRAEIADNTIHQHPSLKQSVSTSSFSFHPKKRHKLRKHRHGLRHKRAIVVIRRRFR